MFVSDGVAAPDNVKQSLTRSTQLFESSPYFPGVAEITGIGLIGVSSIRRAVAGFDQVRHDAFTQR